MYESTDFSDDTNSRQISKNPMHARLQATLFHNCLAHLFQAAQTGVLHEFNA